MATQERLRAITRAQQAIRQQIDSLTVSKQALAEEERRLRALEDGDGTDAIAAVRSEEDVPWPPPPPPSRRGITAARGLTRLPRGPIRPAAATATSRASSSSTTAPRSYSFILLPFEAAALLLLVAACWWACERAAAVFFLPEVPADAHVVRAGAVAGGALRGPRAL